MLESNYVFTTEGHPLPVLSTWHEELPEAYIPTNWTNLKVFASTKLHSPHLHKTHELEKCLYIFSAQRPRRASAMSLQVCPAMTLDSGQHIESACHIPDVRSDYKCLTDEDCGVDSITCRRRSCSMAGYCGLWLFL